MPLSTGVNEYLAYIGQVLRRHAEKSRTKKSRRASFLVVSPETLEARARAAAQSAKTPEERRLIASIWFEAAIERGGGWLFTQFRPEEVEVLTRYDVAMGMYWLARGLDRAIYCDDVFALRLGTEMLFADSDVQVHVSPHIRDVNLRETLLLCIPLAGLRHFIPNATSIMGVIEGVKASDNGELVRSLEHVIGCVKDVSPEMGILIEEMYRETK